MTFKGLMFREPFQMLGVPVSVPLDQFWSFLSNQTRIYIYNIQFDLQLLKRLRYDLYIMG